MSDIFNREEYEEFKKQMERMGKTLFLPMYEYYQSGLDMTKFKELLDGRRRENKVSPTAE